MSGSRFGRRVAPGSARFAALVAAALLAGCQASVGSSPAAGSTASPRSGAAIPGCPSSQPPPLPTGQTRTVTIATRLGSIAIEVEGALSPIATGNFVALASCGFYDGVVFHRVVPGFVIQGGDGQFGRAPDLDRARIGTGGPGYTIQDEPVTATYARGVVAMARTPAPNSQGSQFFIVLDDQARESLADANTYAILGHVTSGMEVADAIASAADAEIPSNPVAMDRLTVTSP
ncbi:MAG TPA: peptidylprolyl isomerase [Candidatus Limnocylindrales bacterium]|nr:peptidylprolyl isomerase [Candidatus Limnocylindrales bacterium]